MNNYLPLSIAITAGILAGCGGGGSDVDPKAACSALVDSSIAASEIGLPTTGAVVQTASFVAAGDAGNVNGEHCEVKGLIHPQTVGAPDIEYQVNLPSSWNNKAVHYGGGAYDGSVVTGLNAAAMHPSSIARPLAQGFITLGSDSGHKTADTAWALNDEALANFGHQQIKKTHDVAVALAKRRFGKAPSRFYFVGNSQGGHEALDAAAVYPADYDGVVATHPAYNVTLLHLGSLNVVKAGAENNGTGWLNPAKHTLVKNFALAACDALDGLTDSIIGNVAACRQTLTMAKLRVDVSQGGLRCASGVDAGDTCLSGAQLNAVEKITSPYQPGFAIAGMDTFPGWGMLEGADLPLGNTAIPSILPTANDSFFANIASYTVKYVITKTPDFNILNFDPLQFQARTQQVGTIMDVTDQDLSAFRAKGGKIIMTHGTADQLITERNSEAYYQRQLGKFGKAGLDSFLRFYVIPGFAHGAGIFTARYDGLSQLVNWVENGNAPQNFTTVDEATATAGRTRPLCQYGTYPRFSGAAGASATAASSFSCVPNS